MSSKHINTAIKLAQKSSFRQRVSAVLFRGSKVLGTGYNRTGESQNRLRTSHWPDSRHAEVDAVVDALRRYPASELKGADILVVRLKKDGSYGLALPCEDCYQVLTNIGIRRIIFTTNEQTLGVLK